MWGGKFWLQGGIATVVRPCLIRKLIRAEESKFQEERKRTYNNFSEDTIQTSLEEPF